MPLRCWPAILTASMLTISACAAPTPSTDNSDQTGITLPSPEVDAPDAVLPTAAGIASPNPSGTPPRELSPAAAGVEWSLSGELDPDVPAGVSISITFPATPKDSRDVATAVRAIRKAGVAGEFLLAKVTNDSEAEVSVTGGTVVTSERSQLELDAGVMLLNAVQQANDATYTAAVRDVNLRFADMQGFNIKPGVDAYVVLATQAAVPGTTALYLRVNGVDVQARRGSSESASGEGQAELAVDGDISALGEAGAIANDLGCSRARKYVSKSGEIGPKPTSAVQCRRGNRWFHVAAYDSKEAAQAVMTLASEFAKAYKMSFDAGVGPSWVVTASGNLTDLPQDLRDEIAKLGGSVERIGTNS